MALPLPPDSLFNAVNPDFYICLYSPWQRGGHVLPHFSGVAIQRGQGFFSDLIQFAVPILKKIARAAMPHLIPTARDIVSDISSGSKLKDTLQKRGIKLAKHTAVDALSGSGCHRRRKSKKRGKVVAIKKRATKKRR